MIYDAYATTFALICLGSSLVVLGLGLRAALWPPRNRYVTWYSRPWRAWCARRAAKRLRIRVPAGNCWGRPSHPDTGATPRHAES